MSTNFELLKLSASTEMTRTTAVLKKAGREKYKLSADDTHFTPLKTIAEKLKRLLAAY